MSEPFLAEIRIFGFNFAPRGWALCDGQILPINQYQALYSLMGTTYGGDGRTTFALPDLRGRVPLHGARDPVLPTARSGAVVGPSRSVSASLRCRATATVCRRPRTRPIRRLRQRGCPQQPPTICTGRPKTS